LFENRYGDFVALFPELADERRIRFSDYLRQLARRRPVRIITVWNQSSEYFAQSPGFQGTGGVQFRYAPETYHKKGVLTPAFYIEGSMNITYPTFPRWTPPGPSTTPPAAEIIRAKERLQRRSPKSVAATCPVAA
jgi:hypothetical protein